MANQIPDVPIMCNMIMWNNSWFVFIFLYIYGQITINFTDIGHIKMLYDCIFQCVKLNVVYG